MTEPVKQSAGSEGPAVIGPGMIIKGSLHNESDVFLDVEVEGGLDVENCRLMIGPPGKVVAKVSAREVNFHGVMTGNMGKAEIVTGLPQRREVRNGE